MKRRICAICRRSRLDSQLQEEHVVCRDRSSCFKSAAMQAVAGPTPAQDVTLRLSRASG